MRLIVYMSGTIGLSLFVIGYLFKIMHWPFAGLLLTISLLIIAIVAIPLAGYHKYNKDKELHNKTSNEDILDQDFK